MSLVVAGNTPDSRRLDTSGRSASIRAPRGEMAGTLTAL
jgi:hypothetical protein